MIEWISVKKQMPTVCGDYLVCYPAHCGGQEIDIAHITDDVFTIWDSRFGEDFEMRDVTHWAHMTYPEEKK